MFSSKNKITIDVLFTALENNHMKQIKEISSELSPEQIAKVVSRITSIWYAQRQYNDTLPMLGKFIVKTDKWFEPTLKYLQEGKNENNLNGWFGAARVIGAVQILGSEYIQEILRIIENSYCDPESGWIGRDGLAEMMTRILPYMPPNLYKNWMVKTLESIDDMIDLGDKDIEISNIYPLLDDSNKKKQLIEDATSILQEKFRIDATDNSHILALSKEKASKDFKEAIEKLELAI